MGTETLKREHLKCGNVAGVRAKNRRAGRSERQQARITLAQAFVGMFAIERSPYEGIFWIENGARFVRYDNKAEDFVDVDMKELKSRELEIVAMAEDGFGGFLHPAKTKNPDGKPRDRANAVRRWLRSQTGRPWASVFSRLVGLFNHGLPFLGYENVHEYGKAIAANKSETAGDFFVDATGAFRYQPCVPEKHMGTVIKKLAKPSVAERMRTEEAEERELKELLREGGYKMTRRKAKRRFGRAGKILAAA